MKKTTIRDIEIIYDDSQSSQMDYIKKVISNNYGWFLGLLGTCRIISLVPMENDDVIYLSDFDEFFYDAVRISFNNERIKQQCGDVNPIIFLYFMYLAKEIGNDENLLFKLNSMCDDDLLYSIIAYKYFLENGNFDDFVNYLKDRKDNDKIIGWLQEKGRFDTYNFLLERLVKFLEENGFDFLEDICVLSDDMLSKLIVSVNSGLIEDLTGNKIKLPVISMDEFEKFCIETGKPLFNFDFLEKDKDVFKSVDDECDEYIKNYVKNGFLVINGFQYVLDTFLADNVLEKKFTDLTIMPKMIDITNKLGDMNLREILEVFDMQDIFCQSEMSGKTKIKRS